MGLGNVFILPLSARARPVDRMAAVPGQSMSIFAFHHHHAAPSFKGQPGSLFIKRQSSGGIQQVFLPFP
jgi:hypothetical protein